MNIKNVGLQDFLALPGTIFDVRSPVEYELARIPLALNLPLFTNEERAAIGTLYKQNGKNQAIELGISFVGPKLIDFVKNIKNNSNKGFAKIHCWRGGMRSQSMAWLAQTAGYAPITLEGGYKTFRKWVLSFLNQSFKLIVIGGFTGTGKTEVLSELKKLGEQVIDLEHLALHRGSTFGHLAMPSQPSIEQFENELAYYLNKLDLTKAIWIEDESRMIGKCKLPDLFYNQMRSASLLFLQTSKEKRSNLLRHTYGLLPKELLMEATERLSKRLGGARTQQIISNIHNGDMDQAISLLLDYYDSTYVYGTSLRQKTIEYFQIENLTFEEIAHKLKKAKKAYLTGDII